jgi:hypothetical protein
MKLDVVIPIDDTHPEIGWGVRGDKCTDYLIKLNQEFGCKFVQFVPSNYHRKFPLSENKTWVDYWKQFDWIELAAHGHFHDRVNPSPSCRECEFIELDYKSAKDRIEQSLEEWDKVNHRPKGWRMPGWVASQGAFDAVSEYFDYVAIHGHLNNNINIDDIRVFKGENPIHMGNTLEVIGNKLLFQSHIAGKYNKNNWTEENYTTFKATLKSLKHHEYDLNYKTFLDLC